MTFETFLALQVGRVRTECKSECAIRKDRFKTSSGQVAAVDTYRVAEEDGTFQTSADPIKFWYQKTGLLYD
jgi:hypothetical protein